MNNKLMDKVTHDETGEVMLESLIVYLVTFTLLFMVLALIMVSYQKFTIKTVAADVAVKVAQNLRYGEIEIEDGNYTKENIKSMKAYRYLFGQDKELINSIESMGEKYTYNRLIKTTFKNVVTDENTDFSIKLVSDGPALRHITVTIKGDYKLPFDDILDFFNLKNITEYEAVESAECVDVLDYVNYIDFSKNTVDALYGDLGGLGKLVDKIWALINRFINY